MLAQFYADFNKLFAKVKEIFPITADVKEMLKRQNKMIFVCLGELRPKISKARPNVIDNSTVKSLEDTYHCLREVVSKSQNPANVETQIIQLLQSKAEQHEVEAIGAILEVAVVVMVMEEDEER